MGFCERLCSVVLAIFLPPLAVLIMRGCGKDLAINILLTILIWIPGVIHALYISCAPKGDHRDGDGLPVTYAGTAPATATAGQLPPGYPAAK